MAHEAIDLADLDAIDREHDAANGQRYGAGDGTDAEPAPQTRIDDLASPATAEWFRDALPGRRYLLRDRRTDKGVLVAGRVGMLLGAGGEGKTQATIQLALAVATGGVWLGTYYVTPSAADQDARELAAWQAGTLKVRPVLGAGKGGQGRVLILAGEEDLEELRRRLHRSREGLDAAEPPPGSIVVVPLASIPCALVEAGEDGNPKDSAFARALLEYVMRTGPWSLILIDPLSRFAGLDAEVSNAHATRFIQAAEALAKATSASVLVSHHTNKASRGKAGTVDAASSRGSSAFTDGARWVATMARERDVPDTLAPDMRELVSFAVDKSNYTVRGDPFLLKRVRGVLVPLTDEERTELDEARKAANPSAARRAEGDAAREAREAREEAHKAGKAKAAAEARSAAHLAQDRALVAALRACPAGCGTRELRAAMVNAGQSRDAVDATLARLGPAVAITPGGPGKPTMHTLSPAAELPEHLR